MELFQALRSYYRPIGLLDEFQTINNNTDHQNDYFLILTYYSDHLLYIMNDKVNLNEKN
jgi:hypothetical protein